MTAPFWKSDSLDLANAMPESLGMRLAVKQSGCCDGVFRMPGGGGIGGLTPEDGAVLEDWLSAARNAGIETVSDLTARPWQVAQPDLVIGVFETGQTAASWLVIRAQGRWVVATVPNDTVSDAHVMLADALRLIRN